MKAPCPRVDWIRGETFAAIGSDLRYAVRALGRNRAMTAIAVLSLSLGLGANIAIFSLLNAVLLRSLPVEDPSALVGLSHHGKDDGEKARAQFSNFPLYEFIRDHNRSYAGVLGFSSMHLRLRRDETSVSIPAQWVSPNYFSLLGVRAALGRTWLPDDAARSDAVVISDRLWRREFGSDPKVLGRSATLNGQPFTIVGVLPPEFVGLIPGAPVDVTLLLAAQPMLGQGNLVTLGLGAHDEPVPMWPWCMVGRLRPQVSVAAAQAETATLFTQMIEFVNRAAETVAALPGIESASATHLEPLGQQQSQRWLTVRDDAGDAPPRVAEFNVVSSDYFRTMRLPIVQGRAFDRRDGADAPKVAIVSESLARLCFGRKDPVGQPAWIARNTQGTPLTIVGVARDVKQRDIREAPLPMLFLPAAQSTAWEMNLLVRTKGDGADPAAELRRTLATVSSDVPIREITTPQLQMNRTLLQERVLAALSGFFGPLALLLAAIGLYGLLAYHVACRTREIGVRAALGASTGTLLRLVLRRGLVLVSLGTLLGSGGAIWVAQALRRFLFALSPYDPLVFAEAVGVLGVVGVLACLVPARRATKVDPVVALRHS